MGNKSLADRSPFRRKGSASAKIYAVLAKSQKLLPAEAIAKQAKISEKKARTLLAAYMNPYHNAPLRRAGVAIVNKNGAFKLVNIKATPKAARPTRGKLNPQAKLETNTKKKAQKLPKRVTKNARKPKTKIKQRNTAQTSIPPAILPAVESSSDSAREETPGI